MRIEDPEETEDAAAWLNTRDGSIDGGTRARPVAAKRVSNTDVCRRQCGRMRGFA